MTTMTLTRANRLHARICARRAQVPLTVRTDVSIFTVDPLVELGRRADTFSANVERRAPSVDLGRHPAKPMPSSFEF
jgi:hypothetical protein